MTTFGTILKIVIGLVVSLLIFAIGTFFGAISMDSGYNSGTARFFAFSIVGLIWLTWWLLFRNSGVRMRWWMWVLAILGSLFLLGVIAG